MKKVFLFYFLCVYVPESETFGEPKSALLLKIEQEWRAEKNVLDWNRRTKGALKSNLANERMMIHANGMNEMVAANLLPASECIMLRYVGFHWQSCE